MGFSHVCAWGEGLGGGVAGAIGDAIGWAVDTASAAASASDSTSGADYAWFTDGVNNPNSDFWSDLGKGPEGSTNGIPTDSYYDFSTGEAWVDGTGFSIGDPNTISGGFTGVNTGGVGFSGLDMSNFTGVTDQGSISTIGNVAGVMTSLGFQFSGLPPGVSNVIGNVVGSNFSNTVTNSSLGNTLSGLGNGPVSWNDVRGDWENTPVVSTPEVVLENTPAVLANNGWVTLTPGKGIEERGGVNYQTKADEWVNSITGEITNNAGVVVGYAAPGYQSLGILADKAEGKDIVSFYDSSKGWIGGVAPQVESALLGSGMPGTFIADGKFDLSRALSGYVVTNTYDQDGAKTGQAVDVINDDVYQNSAGEDVHVTWVGNAFLQNMPDGRTSFSKWEGPLQLGFGVAVPQGPYDLMIPSAVIQAHIDNPDNAKAEADFARGMASEFQAGTFSPGTVVLSTGAVSGIPGQTEMFVCDMDGNPTYFDAIVANVKDKVEINDADIVNLMGPEYSEKYGNAADSLPISLKDGSYYYQGYVINAADKSTTPYSGTVYVAQVLRGGSPVPMFLPQEIVDTQRAESPVYSEIGDLANWDLVSTGPGESTFAYRAPDVDKVSVGALTASALIQALKEGYGAVDTLPLGTREQTTYQDGPIIVTDAITGERSAWTHLSGTIGGEPYDTNIPQNMPTVITNPDTGAVTNWGGGYPQGVLTWLSNTNTSLSTPTFASYTGNFSNAGKSLMTVQLSPDKTELYFGGLAASIYGGGVYARNDVNAIMFQSPTMDIPIFDISGGSTNSIVPGSSTTGAGLAASAAVGHMFGAGLGLLGLPSGIANIVGSGIDKTFGAGINGSFSSRVAIAAKEAAFNQQLADYLKGAEPLDKGGFTTTDYPASLVGLPADKYIFSANDFKGSYSFENDELISAPMGWSLDGKGVNGVSNFVYNPGVNASLNVVSPRTTAITPGVLTNYVFSPYHTMLSLSKSEQAQVLSQYTPGPSWASEAWHGMAPFAQAAGTVLAYVGPWAPVTGPIVTSLYVADIAINPDKYTGWQKALVIGGAVLGLPSAIALPYNIAKSGANILSKGAELTKGWVTTGPLATAFGKIAPTFSKLGTLTGDVKSFFQTAPGRAAGSFKSPTGANLEVPLAIGTGKAPGPISSSFTSMSRGLNRVAVKVNPANLGTKTFLGKLVNEPLISVRSVQIKAPAAVADKLGFKSSTLTTRVINVLGKDYALPTVAGLKAEAAVRSGVEVGAVALKSATAAGTKLGARTGSWLSSMGKGTTYVSAYTASKVLYSPFKNLKDFFNDTKGLVPKGLTASPKVSLWGGLKTSAQKAWVNLNLVKALGKPYSNIINPHAPWPSYGRSGTYDNSTLAVVQESGPAKTLAEMFQESNVRTEALRTAQNIAQEENNSAALVRAWNAMRAETPITGPLAESRVNLLEGMNTPGMGIQSPIGSISLESGTAATALASVTGTSASALAGVAGTPASVLAEEDDSVSYTPFTPESGRTSDEDVPFVPLGAIDSFVWNPELGSWKFQTEAETLAENIGTPKPGAEGTPVAPLVSIIGNVAKPIVNVVKSPVNLLTSSIKGSVGPDIPAVELQGPVQRATQSVIDGILKARGGARAAGIVPTATVDTIAEQLVKGNDVYVPDSPGSTTLNTIEALVQFNRDYAGLRQSNPKMYSELETAILLHSLMVAEAPGAVIGTSEEAIEKFIRDTTALFYKSLAKPEEEWDLLKSRAIPEIKVALDKFKSLLEYAQKHPNVPKSMLMKSITDEDGTVLSGPVRIILNTEGIIDPGEAEVIAEIFKKYNIAIGGSSSDYGQQDGTVVKTEEEVDADPSKLLERKSGDIDAVCRSEDHPPTEVLEELALALKSYYIGVGIKLGGWSYKTNSVGLSRKVYQVTYPEVVDPETGSISGGKPVLANITDVYDKDGTPYVLKDPELPDESSNRIMAEVIETSISLKSPDQYEARLPLGIKTSYTNVEGMEILNLATNFGRRIKTTLIVGPDGKFVAEYEARKKDVELMGRQIATFINAAKLEGRTADVKTLESDWAAIKEILENKSLVSKTTTYVKESPGASAAVEALAEKLGINNENVKWLLLHQNDKAAEMESYQTDPRQYELSILQSILTTSKGMYPNILVGPTGARLLVSNILSDLPPAGQESLPYLVEPSTAGEGPSITVKESVIVRKEPSDVTLGSTKVLKNTPQLQRTADGSIVVVKADSTDQLQRNADGTLFVVKGNTVTLPDGSTKTNEFVQVTLRRGGIGYISLKDAERFDAALKSIPIGAPVSQGRNKIAVKLETDVRNFFSRLGGFSASNFVSLPWYYWEGGQALADRIYRSPKVLDRLGIPKAYQKAILADIQLMYDLNYTQLTGSRVELPSTRYLHQKAVAVSVEQAGKDVTLLQGGLGGSTVIATNTPSDMRGASGVGDLDYTCLNEKSKVQFLTNQVAALNSAFGDGYAVLQGTDTIKLGSGKSGNVIQAHAFGTTGGSSSGTAVGTLGFSFDSQPIPVTFVEGSGRALTKADVDYVVRGLEGLKVAQTAPMFGRPRDAYKSALTAYNAALKVTQDPDILAAVLLANFGNSVPVKSYLGGYVFARALESVDSLYSTKEWADQLNTVQRNTGWFTNDEMAILMRSSLNEQNQLKLDELLKMRDEILASEQINSSMVEVDPVGLIARLFDLSRIEADAIVKVLVETKTLVRGSTSVHFWNKGEPVDVHTPGDLDLQAKDYKGVIAKLQAALTPLINPPGSTETREFLVGATGNRFALDRPGSTDQAPNLFEAEVHPKDEVTVPHGFSRDEVVEISTKYGPLSVVGIKSHLGDIFDGISKVTSPGIMGPFDGIGDPGEVAVVSGRIKDLVNLREYLGVLDESNFRNGNPTTLVEQFEHFLKMEIGSDPRESIVVGTNLTVEQFNEKYADPQARTLALLEGLVSPRAQRLILAAYSSPRLVKGLGPGDKKSLEIVQSALYEGLKEESFNVEIPSEGDLRSLVSKTLQGMAGREIPGIEFSWRDQLRRAIAQLNIIKGQQDAQGQTPISVGKVVYNPVIGPPQYRNKAYDQVFKMAIAGYWYQNGGNLKDAISRALVWADAQPGYDPKAILQEVNLGNLSWTDLDTKIPVKLQDLMIGLDINVGMVPPVTVVPVAQGAPVARGGIETMPPIPEGSVRLTHFMGNEDFANTLVSSDTPLNTGRNGLQGTTDAFSNMGEVTSLLETGKTGPFTRGTFGKYVVLLDLTHSEFRLYNDVIRGPEAVPNSKIIGVYNTTTKEFAPNPRYKVSVVPGAQGTPVAPGMLTSPTAPVVGETPWVKSKTSSRYNDMSPRDYAEAYIARAFDIINDLDAKEYLFNNGPAIEVELQRIYSELNARVKAQGTTVTAGESPRGSAKALEESSEKSTPGVKTPVTGKGTSGSYAEKSYWERPAAEYPLGYPLERYAQAGMYSLVSAYGSEGYASASTPKDSYTQSGYDPQKYNSPGYSPNYGYNYPYGYAYGYNYNYGYNYDYGYGKGYGFPVPYGYGYGYPPPPPPPPPGGGGPPKRWPKLKAKETKKVILETKPVPWNVGETTPPGGTPWELNQVAKIDARPTKEGWKFNHWEGDIPMVDSNKTPVTLLMFKDRKVRAIFTKGPTVKMVDFGPNNIQVYLPKVTYSENVLTERDVFKLGGKERPLTRRNPAAYGETYFKDPGLKTSDYIMTTPVNKKVRPEMVRV